MSLYNLTASDIRRFQDHCFIDEEGILRFDSLNAEGYGQFNVSGRMLKAHRVAQDLWGDEPLSATDHVLHKRHGRENRNIVDVRFLYIGTHQQNMRDIAEAGIRKGENNHRSKLTKEQVVSIYTRAWAGERTTALALEFGVANPTVSDIKYGTAWGHLTGHSREELAMAGD